MRQEMDFTGTPKQVTLPGGIEIAGATLDYHKSPTEAPSRRPDSRRRTPAWKRRTAVVSRWLHIYLSMVSFAIVLFFAVRASR